MKSDRRHELEHNTLADWIGAGAARYREYLPTIGVAGIAVIALVLALVFWSGRSGTSAAHAWQEFFNADDPAQLKSIADRYQGSEVALWARLDLADAYTFEASRKLATDRDTALARLREAEQIYADVLKSDASHSAKMRTEVVRRAALPEAKIWEIMGDRAQAIDHYRAIADQYAAIAPDVAAEARSRAADLETPEAADFYQWLAQYKPPAAQTPLPPNADDLFPPLPDKDEPAGTSGDKPGEPANTQAEKPSHGTPAAAANKAAENKDAADDAGTATKPPDPPADAKPAPPEKEDETEKPAAAAPASPQ